MNLFEWISKIKIGKLDAVAGVNFPDIFSDEPFFTGTGKRFSEDRPSREILCYQGGDGGWAEGHEPMGVDLLAATVAVGRGCYQVDGGGWYTAEGKRFYLDEMAMDA